MREVGTCGDFVAIHRINIDCFVVFASLKLPRNDETKANRRICPTPSLRASEASVAI
ncbi:hypothetical protein ACWIUD_07145 [Helicobacter sp. 23-1044]